MAGAVAAPIHRQAGYRYDLSILQAEFSLTQVLDRPVRGRLSFEQVIRENLDLGRPENHLAALSGRTPQMIGRGAMSYQLRRLRLHGMIERIPRSHRYRVTDAGFRTALFFTRTYNRLLRPALAAVLPDHHAAATLLKRSFDTRSRHGSPPPTLASQT